jgi:hypothetical protein
MAPVDTRGLAGDIFDIQRGLGYCGIMKKRSSTPNTTPKDDPFAPFREWGAQGGKAKSKAKAIAARKNGKLGGRPKGKK